MEEFEEQGGIAFLIIAFTKKNEFYYLRFKNLKEYWDRMLSGGRKSFTYKELGEKFKIESKKEVFLHYLERLSDDIISR